MESLMKFTEKKNIIVAGAGFGGITATLKLAEKMGSFPDYKLILIDCHNYQLYTPALYEIASIPQEYAPATILKSSVTISLSDITRGRPVEFLQDEVEGLDIPGKKIVLKAQGELPFEYLVLALGSETNYFNIPGLKESSFPLKTFHDAVRLRSAIEELVKKQGSIKIAVGGGGATGVELVAEFVNFICVLKEEAVKDKKCDAQFVLIEATNEILPGFDHWLVKKAEKRLRDLGVVIKTGHLITSVSSNEIIFKNGEKDSFDILIWAGGVKGPSLFRKLNLPIHERGSLKVDEYLRVVGFDGTAFAIGDNASFTDLYTKKPLAWNVPVAEAEGRLVAQNILSSIKKKPLNKFYPLKKYPYILTVGKKFAIADLVYLKLSGIIGWLLKQIVELRYLLFILPLPKAIGAWLRAVKTSASND